MRFCQLMRPTSRILSSSVRSGAPVTGRWKSAWNSRNRLPRLAADDAVYLDAVIAEGLQARLDAHDVGGAEGCGCGMRDPRRRIG